MSLDLFYKNKKVLVTGHTGFKGAWLSKILQMLGAQVVGYALEASTNLSIFEICEVSKGMDSIIGDIRDYAKLEEVFQVHCPEIVFHLAAQPLVRESYLWPRETYETNMMGTVNILECCRRSHSVKSVVNITTDKVYLNKEWIWGYRENEELDGFDPYSNSKSCSELITHCYKRSFFDKHLSVSTARAGNVIGGGDFSKDRIIPDCVIAAKEKKDIFVRNPKSIRPYQHVLEPLHAYLLIAKMQYDNINNSDYYNVGPFENDCIETKQLVDIFIKKWGDNILWRTGVNEGPHEANFLKLDCSKIRNKLGWEPRWNVEQAIEETVEWYKIWCQNGNVINCMEQQIKKFFNI